MMPTFVRVTVTPWLALLGCAVVWPLIALASDPAVVTPDVAILASRQGSTDPESALSRLRQLRETSQRSDDPRLHWAIDAAECRILQDRDVNAAARVANAGLKHPSPAIDAPAATWSAWLGLRACAASVMLLQSETGAGFAELEAVLAASTIPGLEGAHAIALMERGVARSHIGDLVRAQADLLAACETLNRLQWLVPARDCLDHLASHYQRAGEYDLALKYHGELLMEARARGARSDEGSILRKIARVHLRHNELEIALDSFKQARAIELAENNPLGIAYNDAGIGTTLLAMKQPTAAIPFLQHAESVFARLGDNHAENTRVSIAAALAATGHSVEAMTLINRTEPDVRARGDDLLLAELLDARANAQAGMGQWQNAFNSMRAHQAVLDRINTQRHSEQAARLRLQFDSEKNAARLEALEQINARERKLQQTQQAALALALALLALTGLYAWHKWKLARRLRTLALVDDLTRIANRRAILTLGEDLLRQARVSDSALSVLVIDIDHFKSINDRLGHAAGDRVLRNVALLISDTLRPRDGFGRLGGEEFLVLLPATATDGAVVLAERVREAIAATTLATHGQPVQLTISVGVATARRGDAFTRLLERCDRALYQAKSEGRNRVCVADEAWTSGRWTALTLDRLAALDAPASGTSPDEHVDHPPGVRRA
jgi:diguanylate cyclase (GGDEF)-like protein